MPRAWHEAAGWVVRESRHQRAAPLERERACEITYADGELRVDNDGARTRPARADGSGLRGLRERLAPLGASLDADPAGDGRWLVDRRASRLRPAQRHRPGAA